MEWLSGWGVITKHYCLASATTLFLGQLNSDRHGMEELGLATSVLAIDFADTARLEATFQDLVPTLASSADLEASLAFLKQLGASDETVLFGWLEYV